MPLTHKVIERYPLPVEGEWVEMRMPSKAILDRARMVKAKQAISLMAGVDFGAIRSATATAEVDDASQEPGSAYDWILLFSECFTAWSFDEPVTKENIAELDEASVNYLLAQLFPAETVEERKKGSNNSTHTSKEKLALLKSG